MTQGIFLVTRSRGARWDDSRPMEDQEEWPSHAAFMNSLESEGFVVLGGPVTGTRHVLLVVRASDEQEIQERLSRDPWSRKELLRVTEIRPWTLRLGSLPNRRPGGNTESIALIRRFIEACFRADADEFAGYFTQDAVWWNSPWPPVTGRDGIRETLRRGAQRMTALPWEIRHIVADDGVVLTERVDNFLVGETRVRVPCMGIFELRDGKIAAWRDYWDLQQFERQLPGKAQSSE